MTEDEIRKNCLMYAVWCVLYHIGVRWQVQVCSCEQHMPTITFR